MSRLATPAAVLGGALLGVVAVVVGRLAGTDVPWLVAVPAGAVAGVLVAVALSLPTSTPPAPPLPDVPPVPSAAGLGDLASLVFTLEGAARDGERFETRVRPRLAALAVDRIWLSHGLDWRTPAGRAAAEPLLGPHVRALLTAPPRTLRLTPAAVADWTKDLEQL